MSLDFGAIEPLLLPTVIGSGSQETGPGAYTAYTIFSAWGVTYGLASANNEPASIAS